MTASFKLVSTHWHLNFKCGAGHQGGWRPTPLAGKLSGDGGPCRILNAAFGSGLTETHLSEFFGAMNLPQLERTWVKRAVNGKDSRHRNMGWAKAVETEFETRIAHRHVRTSLALLRTAAHAQAAALVLIELSRSRTHPCSCPRPRCCPAAGSSPRPGKIPKAARVGKGGLGK